MRKILFLLALLLLSPSAAHAQFLTIGNPIMPIYSAAAESSHIMKASSGALYSFSATATAAGYVMVFDSATVPADGAVSPAYCYNLAANATTGANWFDIPASFSNGIVLVYSSTGCFTKTASATAFFSAQAR